jgi:Fe2+ or Zn2+ uptake regulation protein
MGAAMNPPRSTEHHRQHHTHDHDEERIEQVLEGLREEGGRVTVGRRAIVAALLTGDDHHVTADELAAAVQARHPDLHLSTVYRTLETLEHAGVVAKVDLGQGRAVYHLVDHVHHHLVCELCGSVTEVPDAMLDPLAAALQAQYGFAASPHRLTITGLCRSCRSSAP